MTALAGNDVFSPSTPYEQRTVRSADGTAINVELYGNPEGPTVVLVHGWTCNISFWVLQIKALAPDHRVVTYDQRGHGASAEPGPAGFSPAGLADDLSAVLDDVLDDGERAVLGGHSMGAMTMIAFAGRHAEQLRRQVAAGVMASTGMNELMPRSTIVPMPQVVAKRVIPLSTFVIGQPQRGVNGMSKAVLKYASLSRTADPAQVEFCARVVQDCSPRTRREFARMFSRMDLSGDIAEFSAPTVVIAGARDKLTPVWHTRRLAAQLPNLVDSVELPHDGHMTPIQSPEEVSGALRTMVRKHLNRTVSVVEAAPVVDVTAAPTSAAEPSASSSENG
ncbi:alpha/beta fold hydrolase [Spongisporangium articulatum]|uniref:Alpha/beta fold hydrolase n=1 Tax=Spongisporangium articulatum TaxID=3362603 RepID=A0ABW8AJD1_9ACTN